jgi:hypothetical protein
VADGVILFANCHYCEQFNSRPGEILGLHIWEIYPDAKIYQQWQAILTEKGEVTDDEITDYEIEVTKADGTSGWMAMSAFSVLRAIASY